MAYPPSRAASARPSRLGEPSTARLRTMSCAASSAASVGTGAARGVSGASTACPRAFRALAVISSSGCDAEMPGSLITTAGRTRGLSAGTPGAWRWMAVISAPESVVGIATTRRGGSAAASDLAVSITRPPPRATRVAAARRWGRSSPASSFTMPGPIAKTPSAAWARSGSVAAARSVVRRVKGPPTSSVASAAAPRPKRTRRSPSRQANGATGSSAGDDSFARGRALAPGERVARVVQVPRQRREPQRTERVAHHGELLGAAGAEGALDEPRLRPVRQARRMERDGLQLDPLPRSELTGDVVDHRLGLQVRVMVWQRHGHGVVVQLAGAERADDEAGALEGLVHRRGLVHAPRDRLEVVDVERVRVDVAVPSHDVERVVVERVPLVAIAHAHDQLAVLAVAVRDELRRRVDVAMRVRRALEQLPVAVAVPVRRLDLARRVERQIELVALREEPVDRPARDDDVVALPVRQRAEGGLELARALVDEDHLVALAVLVERALLAHRPADGDLHVVVPHQEPATVDRAALRLDVLRVHQVPRVSVGHPLLPRDRRELAQLLDAAGGLEVVEDRLVAREALVAHDLLGQERPVLAQDGVALARQLPPLLVAHQRFPRLSCSR